MATDLATLAIKVENGDVIKATTSLNTMAVAGGKTEAATQRLTRRMALLELEARQMDTAMSKSARTFGLLSTGMDKATAGTSALRNAFAAIGTALAVREVVGMADAYSNLQSRLSLVTTGTGNLAAVQARLFTIAQESRTSFEATADLYTRVARGADALGASQSDLLRVTDAINKTLAISGASASASQAALVQLGQAFASGTLRGEELNSVLEQAPRLADAIARGMGKTTGELRKMGAEGKLSAKAVFDAIKSQGTAIDEEFGRMPKTIGGAMQQIRNEFLLTIGAMDKASGASGGIVTALDAIRNAIGPTARAVNAFFGGFAIAAADAAIGTFKFEQSVLKLQERIARGLFNRGEKPTGIAKFLLEGAEKGLKDGEDQIRLLEKQRDATIALVHATAELGTVSTTTKPVKPVIVDPNAAKDLEAIQKATDKYYNTLNQRQIDALNAAKASREQNDQLRALIAAYGEGQAAVERVTIAQAGENAVKELGAGVSAKVAASVRREAEEHERLAISLGKVKDAQAERAREAERAADEAMREMERRAKDLHRTISGTIEGIITDISNRRNPFVALFENLKRGAIKAISDILATKIQDKVGDFLGIKSMASKQEQAAKLMKEAADKQLRAAEIWAGKTPSGAGAPSGAQQSATVKFLQQMLRVGGAGYGGYQTGTAIGAMTGDRVSGAIGGAAAGAYLGAKVAGPVGAAVGGIAGFVGGIIGAGDAAKAARERLQELKDAFQNTFDSLKAELSKDTLGQAVAQVKAAYQSATKQFKEAFTGEALAGLIFGDRGKWEDYKKTLGDLTEMEAKRVAQLEREFAVLQKRSLEDFEARRDAATPGNEAAEAFEAFVRKLDREREDLITSFGAVDEYDKEIDARERAILAMADQAFAAEKEQAAREKATGALDAFSTAVRNAPTGFKLEPYIQEFAKGRPYPGQFPAPLSPFVPPMSPLSPPSLSRTGTIATAPITFTGPVTIPITVSGDNKSPREIAKEVVGEFDRKAAQLGGLNSSRVNGMEAYS